jgi:Mannosyl-glycoprotein endo-beta-N-acetylglucosaminidase.
VNDYYYSLAQRAAGVANSYEGGGNILPEWIYCQWAHETADFTSTLCVQYNNLGGLCQSTPNDTPQPDGNQYYMQFATPEAYADYFGKYLHYYREDGVYEAPSLEDYVRALKHGGYFGASLEEYLAGTGRIYQECFA